MGSEAVFSAIGLSLIGLGFSLVTIRALPGLRDESEIKQGATVAIIWTILADSGAVVTGMVGRLLTQPGQSDSVLEIRSGCPSASG